MELTGEELATLRGILDRALTEPRFDWNAARAEQIRLLDPLAAVLIGHQPWQNGSRWGCTCDSRNIGYVSRNHVLLTHIRPLIDKAATQKIRGILDRAGMDLDVMINSDKIFGGDGRV